MAIRQKQLPKPPLLLCLWPCKAQHDALGPVIDSIRKTEGVQKQCVSFSHLTFLYLCVVPANQYFTSRFSMNVMEYKFKTQFMHSHYVQSLVSMLTDNLIHGGGAVKMR